MSIDNLSENLNNNKNIPKRCVISHDLSRRVFAEIMNKYKIPFRETPLNEDMETHVDYIITLNKKEFKIDIKTMLKLMNNDLSNPDYDWMWVEYKNVYGKDGWIYGLADFIGVLFPDKMWMVSRKELLNFCNKHVSQIVVEDKSDCNYKLYSRSKLGRKDVITKINRKDVEKECKIFLFTLTTKV